MRWLNRLRAAAKAARVALAMADALVEGAEDLADLYRRQGRDAKADDLLDSLETFRQARLQGRR